MQQVDIPTNKLPIILACILRQLEKLSGTVGGDLNTIVDLTPRRCSQPDQSIEEQIKKASEYRAAPVPPANYAHLEVIFKPNTKEIDIRKLLTKLNASIIDGPGEFGQYRVKIQAGLAQEAINTIKASGLADSVTGE